MVLFRTVLLTRLCGTTRKMKVWLVFVNGKVDRVCATGGLAADRVNELVKVNGDQLPAYCREETVHGYFEETE